MTEQDREFYLVGEEYSEKFNKNYPLPMFDNHPLSFHINRMREAIKANKPVADPPAPPDGAIV